MIYFTDNNREMLSGVLVLAIILIILAYILGFETGKRSLITEKGPLSHVQWISKLKMNKEDKK